MTAKTWAVGGTSDYDLGSNWDPTGAPGPGDTATFGADGETSIAIGAASGVAGWTFDGNRSYAMTVGPAGSIQFLGLGITVLSGSANITGTGAVEFDNTSSAGTASLASSLSSISTTRAPPARRPSSMPTT